MSTSYKPTIAIIGGGFSGCLTAVHLLRNARQPLRIVMLEREDVPGRGVAYRDQPECHLLNVRAEGMSAFPDQPDHFLDWLNQHYSPCHPVGTSEFLPRRIYGAYVQAVLTDALANARRGVTLETRSDEVVGLRRAVSGFQLQTRSGSRLRADQVVLALGNPGPADPPLRNASIFASPRYLGSAWSTPGLYAMKRDESLLLIGSGLTTLDWLVALHGMGHRGQIHVVSRRGLLPHLHAPAAPHKLFFDPMALPPRVAPLLHALRDEAARLEAAGGNWRSVIDALRPYTQLLWQRLPLRERRRFMRHVRPYWEIHRHRAAPKIVDTVYELLRSGTLQLQPGRLLDLTEHADGIDVRLRPRSGGPEQRFTVQRVVNCTGPESNYRRMSHPLIADLREQGLLQPDELGLGVLTDDNGGLIDSADRLVAGLYTLGPPRKGQLWETTAVPEIRVQAQALARRLVSERVEIPIAASSGDAHWV